MNSTLPASLPANENELVHIGKTIDGIRRALRPVPSARAWVKSWPGLGSDKTLRMVLRGEFDNLNVDTQLGKYRAVLSAIQANSKHRANEELYDDLAPAQVVALAALRLMNHYGKDRLLLVVGGSGAGKTSALQLLQDGPAAGVLTIVDADETWKSLRAALGDILTAIGVPEKKIPMSTAGRMSVLIKTLNDRGRVMIAIDEAHHCTGPVLNCIKTILNRTDCLMILAGMDTLLRKLRHIASEESKQLFHNRLFSKVELSTPGQGDAKTFLSRRLNGGSWQPGTLKKLSSLAKNSGHWAFLRRVADLLQDAGLTAEEADDSSLLQIANQAVEEIS